jgi:hypothetical protein
LRQASAMYAANWDGSSDVPASAPSARTGRGDVLETVTTTCAYLRCTRCGQSVVVVHRARPDGGELAVEAPSSAGLSLACDHEREQLGG